MGLPSDPLSQINASLAQGKPTVYEKPASNLFTCQKLYFNSATFERTQGLLGKGEPRLIMRLEADKATLTDMSTGKPYTERLPVPFQGAAVAGSFLVTFVDKQSQAHSVGVVTPDSPNLDTLLRVSIPLDPQLVRFMTESWTKGRFTLQLQSSIVTTNVDLLQQHAVGIVEFPRQVPFVQFRRPDTSEVQDISIDEVVLEAVRDGVIITVPKEGLYSEHLVSIRDHLVRGKTQKATTLLRDFIMNQLTTTAGSGQPRAFREEVKKRLTGQLSGHALQVRQENIQHLEEEMRSALQILHQFVKDDKMIDEPDPMLVEYVFRNVASLVDLLRAIPEG
jgi:hypothetical protein